MTACMHLTVCIHAAGSTCVEQGLFKVHAMCGSMRCCQAAFFDRQSSTCP